MPDFNDILVDNTKTLAFAVKQYRSLFTADNLK